MEPSRLRLLQVEPALVLQPVMVAAHEPEVVMAGLAARCMIHRVVDVAGCGGAGL